MTELSEVVMLIKNSFLLDSKILSSISVKLKHVCGIDGEKVNSVCISSKSLPAAQKNIYYKSP